MSTLDKLFRATEYELQAILDELSASEESTETHKSRLRDKWNELHRIPAWKDRKLRTWKQKRGYALEKLVLALCALDKLQPHAPYRPAGEQIDGMFILDGRAFLVETRWRERETSAADIFAFQGKLRGKLAGTLGIFVSTNGFAEDAAKAVAWGKEINVLFFDKKDIDLALSPDYHFAHIMRIKLRRAAQRGQVYYPYRSYLDLMNA